MLTTNIIKNYKYICATGLLFALVAQSYAEPKKEPEIRQIVPPKLDDAHISKEVLCHRPMRRGAPNMSVEKLGRQVVAHNYGHGGSGWTLALGAATYVNRLLFAFKDARSLKRKTPITIIGGGVLGLFTAYDLVQNGFKNITIVAESFESLPSHKAGALLAPASMDNSPEMQPIIDQIGFDTYKFYEAIAKKQHKDFKEGASILPAYFDNREYSDLEPYVVGKVMQPAKDVILDFGNGTKRNMVVYEDGIYIDTPKMMAGLTTYLKDKKVKFIKQKVSKFTEIRDRYVINCSGMGARDLNEDDEMVSVQGHLILLKDQSPKDLQYMIASGYKEGKSKSGHQMHRLFYQFPKHLPDSGPNDVGVIGGTMIEGATEQTPNKEEFANILKEAKDFYGIK